MPLAIDVPSPALWSVQQPALYSLTTTVVDSSGVSRDSVKVHEGFKERQGFPFDLLSDKDTRAQYDRGEIDHEGNPLNPFAGMGGGSWIGGG